MKVANLKLDVLPWSVLNSAAMCERVSVKIFEPAYREHGHAAKPPLLHQMPAQNKG